MKPRATIHDLNSLRQVIRELQEENNNLKKLLTENGISYEDADINVDESVSDDYDEDQGSRIVPVIPTEDMAKKFFSYFWGRTDVYAKRGKNGGYFPQCASRWDNPNCPKAKNEKQFCDEDCEYKLWKKLDSKLVLKHLLGEKEDCTDVIGVYPLHTDNTCRFLVFDFDNHEKDGGMNLLGANPDTGVVADNEANDGVYITGAFDFEKNEEYKINIDGVTLKVSHLQLPVSYVHIRTLIIIDFYINFHQ